MGNRVDFTVPGSTATNQLYVDAIEIDTTGAVTNQTFTFDGVKFRPSFTFNPSGEAIGFEDRTSSSISFDNGTRVFTIAPTSASFAIWCGSTRYTKTVAETVTLPNASGIYYIYYNLAGALSYKTTFFSLSTEAPVAYVYYNATDGVQYFFADERHGVTMDWATHEYLHLTRGAAFSSGFTASGYTTSGTGNVNTDAQISLADGTFYDEDIPVTITGASAPVANSWQQRLQNGAYIPVYYRSGIGVWKKDTATQYPLKYTTAVNYNNTGASALWSTTAIGANKYCIYWLCATNQLNEPVISIMGQAEYNNIGDAEAASWSDMSLTGLPIVEFRTLYKLVFQNTGTNAVGCRLVSITDYRAAGSLISGAPLNPPTDHGQLSGLSDDDHLQYSLVNGTRAFTGTISGTAASFSGLITAASATLNGKLNVPTSIGPQITLGVAAGTSTYISYLNDGGVALPRITPSISPGTKILLYPAFTAGASADYAIGIGGGVLWNSIPTTTTAYSFRWYAGDIEIANLRGDGVLSINQGDGIAGGTGQVNAAAYNFNGFKNWDIGSYNATGQGAALINDNGSYQALMILGNRSAGGNRIIRMWDDVVINGTTSVTGIFTFGGKTIQTGRTTFSWPGNVSRVLITITFTAGLFSAFPSLVMNCTEITSNTNSAVCLRSGTASSASVVVETVNGGLPASTVSSTIDWIAIGTKA